MDKMLIMCYYHHHQRKRNLPTEEKHTTRIYVVPINVSEMSIKIFSVKFHPVKITPKINWNIFTFMFSFRAASNLDVYWQHIILKYIPLNEMEVTKRRIYKLGQRIDLNALD